jgi:hypothetical protein
MDLGINCVNCGAQLVDAAIWAIYADEAFAERDETQYAFPLDQVCFDRDKTVTIAEWVPDPNSPTNESMLQEREITRYTQVRLLEPDDLTSRSLRRYEIVV